jgi:XRE family transcriptional regulator, regulator of sulfur utilization
MSRQPSPPAIGAIVKSIRKRRNLTLEQLAQRSYVSKSMLSQTERELTNPTIATLWSLADIDVDMNIYRELKADGRKKMHPSI